MKTTTSGRAFTKAIFDIFATLMISLRIENHKIRFRSYPNSFTAECAVANLGSLQFVQSNRGTDPNDPTRIITHVTTTQFSLSRDMARNLCQTFMDARLFECATDSSKREFQSRGLYHVTPKGAHIMAKFVIRNSLSAEDTRHVTTNATTNLVHLERTDDEDAIILTLKHVDTIFKRFAGPEPNMAKGDTNGSSGGGSGSDSTSTSGSASSGGRDRDRTPLAMDLCNGIEVMDLHFNYEMYKHSFYGKSAVEWLLNYATVISKEEAIRICQEMVSAGYIEQAGEEIRDGPSLFKTGSAALYHLTETGRDLAGWKNLDDIGSDNDWMDKRKVEHSHPESNLLSVQFKLNSTSSTSRLPISIIPNERRKSTDEASIAGFQYGDDSSNRGGGGGSSSSGSSTRRLSQILNDPAFQITLSEAGSNGSNSGGVGGSGGGPMSSYAPSSSGRESVGVSAGGPRQSTPLSSTSQSTTSNTSRLNGILSDTIVRDLFKSFLKQNICEENLSFYLEVVDYKSKFSTLISTARAYQQSVPGQEHMAWKESNEQGGWGGWGLCPPSLRELEKQICTQAFAIFETYLVQGASKEVNLPHQMRRDITSYMQAVVHNMETSKGTNNKSEDTSKILPPTPLSPSFPSSTSTYPVVESGSEVEKANNATDNNAGAIQKELIHISLFDTVHDHIFRLMSTDSVPKFIKTDKYLEVVMRKHKRKNAANANGNANGNGNSTSTSTLAHTHGMTLKEAVLASGPESNGETLVDDRDINGSNGGGGGHLKSGNNTNALTAISGLNLNEDGASIRRSVSLNRLPHQQQQQQQQQQFGPGGLSDPNNIYNNISFNGSRSSGAGLTPTRFGSLTASSIHGSSLQPPLRSPRTRSASSNGAVDGMASQQQQYQVNSNNNTGKVRTQTSNGQQLRETGVAPPRQPPASLMDIYAHQQLLQQYSNQRSQLSHAQITHMYMMRQSAKSSPVLNSVGASPGVTTGVIYPDQPVPSLQKDGDDLPLIQQQGKGKKSSLSENQQITASFKSTSFAIEESNNGSKNSNTNSTDTTLIPSLIPPTLPLMTHSSSSSSVLSSLTSHSVVGSVNGAKKAEELNDMDVDIKASCPLREI